MSRVNRYEYNDWKNFGLRVKKYREQIGMTKEKFAEGINRSDNFVSQLERGDTTCSIHTLHQTAKILKVSTDSLLYGDVSKLKKESNNKDILKEIIDRCNDEELTVIKDVIVSMYPHLKSITKKKDK